MSISVLINQRPNCSSFSLHKSSPSHSNVNGSVSSSSSSPIPPKSPKTTIVHQGKKRPSIRNMTMVGFDIGNDTSVVAVVKTQAVHVLLNNDSKYETPSVVSFAQKKRQIGSQAASLALRYPEATISQIKRIIGKRYRWPGVVDELSHLPFLTSEGPDGGILIHVSHADQDREFTPVQILAMLFSNLRKMVETNSGGISTSNYVIGVPSYFTDSQRIAYLDAAEIAGMDRSRLQLMHEGTATALGYGFYKNDLENGSTVVVFVDVGHCATQVTVVEFKVGGLRVLSHASDRNVGGRDFDRVLFDHFRKKFHEERKIDIVAPKNWRSCARLMAACAKAKKDLTSNSQASISIDCLVGDLDASGFVTREDFEEMSRDLLTRIVRTCEKALTLEGIDVSSVSSVELTGSGSRIPAVSDHLTKYFLKNLSRTLNGSECVARGCALQCVLTSPLTSKTYKVEDVLPFTVGYISQPSDQLMFLRGRQFPHSIEYDLELKESFHLDIYQVDSGESDASNTRRFEVGPFEVHGNQYYPHVVKVHISLSRDGIVNVYASLVQRWNNASERLLVTDISGCGMQQNALINAKNEENGLTFRDSEIDDIQEKRNALEAYVYDIQKKFNERYCHFSSESDKRSILKMLDETESWLYEDSDDKSKNVYSEKLRELKELLLPIENRYKISEANDQAARVFERQIENISNDFNSCPADKTNEISTICDQARQWLLALQQLLNLLPKNIEVLLVDDITERRNALIESFEHIKRGKTLDGNRREARSSRPDKMETFGLLRTAKFFLLSLPKKCAGLVGNLANRSFVSNPGIDVLSDEFTMEEPSDLTCDNRHQTNYGRRKSQHHQTPRVNMQMINSNPVPHSPGSRYAVNNSVKPTTLNQGKTCQDVKDEEVGKKEAIEAFITEMQKKFLEWFGSFATDSVKEDLSNKMKNIMHAVNQEYENNIQIDEFCRVEELQSIVKSNQELYLDEEANAAAVRDLLYDIFQYRVQVISSKNLVEKVQHKCREIEEWLEDRMMLPSKEPKNSNTVLRFRDIVNKIEELEVFYQYTLQNVAAEDYHANSQITQSKLSDNDVRIVNEEKKTAHEEDAFTLSIPGEIEVPTESMDADVVDRRTKEEDRQGDTSNLHTTPLESDVSLPHHDEIHNDKRAEAEISKNDDKFRDTDTIADPPVSDQQIETSVHETKEALSSLCDMNVD